MNRYDDESPDFSSGFKIVTAVVFLGLLVIAAESPVNWAPTTTTLHDVAAATAESAAAEGFTSGYSFDAAEPEPNVESF